MYLKNNILIVVLRLWVILALTTSVSFSLAKTPQFSIPGNEKDQVCIGNTSLELSQCLANRNYANQKNAVGSNKYDLSIYSNSQEFKQLPNNKFYSVFTGNVRIVYQPDLVILADKVIVDQSGSSRLIKAYGDKVQISSALRNLNLTGTEVVFNIDTNDITAKNATAIYNNNTLSGSTIVYNISTNNISAHGSSSNQVKTIITNLSLRKK